MPESFFFLHQIKRTNGNWDKGIVVKDSFDAAKQGYHAYLGAYAYNHDADTNFVQCMITDMWGTITNGMTETWIAPDPEPEA